VISAELRVNPNTVQKAVAELTSLGLLEVRAGQGCYVAARSMLSPREQCDALAPILERLVIEAAHLGVGEATLLGLMRAKARELKIHLERNS